jgi:hypothetical protein
MNDELKEVAFIHRSSFIVHRFFFIPHPFFLTLSVGAA